jgi:3-mercaptopyruvate sulfurtransferase SseA
MPHLPSQRPVTEVPAADPAESAQHFRRLPAFETDCWDVHASLESGGFVLLDVRSEHSFRRGHVSGAISLPHARTSPRALEQYPPEALWSSTAEARIATARTARLSASPRSAGG